MGVWAQIADSRVTAIPADGRTIVDFYTEFEFSGSPLPEGTSIKWLIGKFDGNADDVNPATIGVEELEALVVPITGLELFEDQSPIEELFIRETDGTLVLKKVSRVKLKPLDDAIEEFSIVAYSTFDKLGTVERLSVASGTFTVSFGEGVFLSVLERYDPVLDIWEEKTAMPTGRSGPFVASVGTNVYCIGGFNGNFTGANEQYDVATDSWTVKTKLPIARAFGATIVSGTDIYVIGGYNYDPSRASKLLHKYDTTNDTWTLLADLPFALAFPTAQLVGSDIWVMFGAIKFDAKEKPVRGNSCVLKYSITSDAWTVEDVNIGDTPTSLSANAAAGDLFIEIPAGTILPLTGAVTIDRAGTTETVYYNSFQNGVLNLLQPLVSAHLAGVTVHIAAIPRDRLGPNSYLDGTTIKVFNGFSISRNRVVGDLESYDISTNVSSIATTPVAPTLPRYKAGQAKIGTDLYIISGSAVKSLFLDEVELFTPDTFTGPSGFTEMNLARSGAGVVEGNDGINDYAFAMGGQGSGHEKGWLKLTVTTSPEKIRADGRATSTILVEAEDSSGDAPPDGTNLKIRGLLYISKQTVAEERESAVESSTGGGEEAEFERTPPPSVSILPVLFSANEMSMTSGKAATVLLDRSEDFINEVENLLDFAKSGEKILGQEQLKRTATTFRNLKTEIGKERQLYNVAIEVVVDDPFFFGQSNSDAAGGEIPDQPIGGGDEFSFNPPSLSQGKSGSVSFFSDIASIPDVQMVTDEPVAASAVLVALDRVREERPFGASPHYDAMIIGAQSRIVEPPAPPLLPPANLMVSTSDNEESGSVNNADAVVEEVNLVDGPNRFPVFVTTVVVTDPISLAARKARTDVADLEKISSETGGNSFSLDRPEYVSFIIDRIKTSAPSSLGSGTITISHDIDGSLQTLSFVVGNMIAGNTAVMTARTSSDGYNFVDVDMTLEAAVGSGDITSTFTLATPIKATIVEYTITMTSKTFDSPVIRSATIQYIKPNVQYLFTYPQTIGGQVTELAAVTNERLPAGATVEVGLVHGDSLAFDRDYVSDSQPTVQQRGTIVAIKRDGPLIDGVVFRDVLTSEDFIIYTSKSGPWALDAVTRVFVNDQEALPDTFVAVPEEGRIVFKQRMGTSDKVRLEVQNVSSFRVGLKITNPSLNSGVLDSFAYMYGESEVSNALRPNRAPLATNLFISPSPVLPGGPMQANYTFTDPDGEEEDADQTQIIWFRNGAPVSELLNKTEVSNSDLIARRQDGAKDNLISKGQEWFFTVRPSDGRSFGPLAVSTPITIANVAPEATSAILVSSNTEDPLKFTTKDNITVEFKATDDDGDEILDSIYTFFVNAVQVQSGTDATLLSTVEDADGNRVLVAGAVVTAEVIPSDGSDFGAPITTEAVTIESSAPTVTDVAILPAKPSPASSLIVSYKFVDIDKDRDQSTIAWFANDERKSDFDNVKQIPRGILKPGQKWYAIVTPNDGSIESEAVKSNVVLVQN